MRIHQLRVTDAYGYLQLDVTFNNELTFLVGVNGAGKTTVLRFLYALISPSLRELYAIPHSQAELHINDGSATSVIRSQNTKEHVSLSIDSVPDSLIFPSITADELQLRADSREEGADFYSNLLLQYADHPVLKSIKSLRSPLFLGLERRLASRLDSESPEIGEYLLLRERRRRNRALFRGSLAASLVETEVLVQAAMRHYRETEALQTRRLRNEILISSFTVANLPKEALALTSKDSENIYYTILERRKDLQQALAAIDAEDPNMQKALTDFFTKLARLIEAIRKQPTKPYVSVELLLNRAQLDRIFRLIKIIDEQQKELRVVGNPLTRFTTAMNDYYQDSGKVLHIDPVGHLEVTRPDKSNVGIQALSSGEQQILILFAHATFGAHSTAGDVFIIDEPELSLHLNWQKNFVSTVRSLNPEIQFILATHSPDIVGEYKSHAINLRTIP